MKLSPLMLGMLHLAGNNCRVYVGALGVEQCGFRSGTRRWRPLYLWWRGLLKPTGYVHHGRYGWPAVYLSITEAGRAALKTAEGATR